MDHFDWALLSFVLLIGIAQIYFAERYHDIFRVDKSTINKTYVSMIRDLVRKHPLAGRIYVGVVSLQAFVLLALAIKSKLP